MEPCPVSWLQEPLPLELIERRLGQHCAHPHWQQLKKQAQAGDEFWAFRSPKGTWAKKLGAAGYALVRKGRPVASFTILRT